MTKQWMRLTTAALALAGACSDGPTPPKPDGRVATVEVTPASPSVAVGDVVTLDAAARSASGDVVSNVTFTWTSDQPTVARVDQASGVVTALAVGTAHVTATGGGKTGSATLTVTDRPLASSGTIAYARGSELRLIEPDGSNDRLVWAAPPVPGQSTLSYTVTSPAWRPDGGEIAFSSDHEEAVSIYERDLYAVRPDGAGFRKITNGPAHDRLASFPKGSLRVRVANGTLESGPFFVIVQGGSAPQMVSIAPGSSVQLTFANVADLGDVAQEVAVAMGTYRWSGASADVRPGGTADAGVLQLGSDAVHGFGADVPFWRHDRSAVGFVGPLCFLGRAPAFPPPGFAFEALLDLSVFKDMCGADWGPTAATENQLLLLTGVPDENGNTYVYRVTEGATSLGAPVATFGRYVKVVDIHWLPDGSGFAVAKQNDLLDERVNIATVTFATGAVTQLTNVDFGGEVVRRFSLSPDGRQIAFERTSDLLFGASDLWIMDRDGSNPRLLVRGGGYPAWNPTR